MKSLLISSALLLSMACAAPAKTLDSQDVEPRVPEDNPLVDYDRIYSENCRYGEEGNDYCNFPDLTLVAWGTKLYDAKEACEYVADQINKTPITEYDIGINLWKAELAMRFPRLLFMQWNSVTWHGDRYTMRNLDDDYPDEYERGPLHSEWVYLTLLNDGIRHMAYRAWDDAGRHKMGVSGHVVGIAKFAEQLNPDDIRNFSKRHGFAGASLAIEYSQYPECQREVDAPKICQEVKDVKLWDQREFIDLDHPLGERIRGHRFGTPYKPQYRPGLNPKTEDILQAPLKGLGKPIYWYFRRDIQTGLALAYEYRGPMKSYEQCLFAPKKK